jgi:hypothetical protein
MLLSQKPGDLPFANAVWLPCLDLLIETDVSILRLVPSVCPSSSPSSRLAIPL